MGLFDALANMLKLRKEQINILVVGLNNSGKSTIVNHFKNPEERPSITVPTVGFSIEKFQSKSMNVTLISIWPVVTKRYLLYLIYSTAS